MAEQFRRWYDSDPILKEALELLRLQPDDTQQEAANFIIELQENVAAEVLEKVYEMVSQYQENGHRWYDKDPVLLKAVELLRQAPPHIQRVAAKKLLTELESKSFEDAETEE